MKKTTPPTLAKAALTVAVAALFLAPAAWGSPIVQTLGNVITQVNTIGPTPVESVYHYDNFNYLNQPQASSATGLVQTARGSNGGQADGSVTAAPGTLKAWAKSGYPAYSAATPWNGYAASQVSAFFADTILVDGGGLAVDTPVRYTLHYWIEGWTSQPAYGVGGAYSAEVTADVRLRDATSSTSSMRTWDSLRDANGWYSLVLDTLVGHELLLSATLAASTYVSSYATIGHEAEADYGHSAHFYLAPSVGGLSLTGASGHDYALPPNGGTVPEPASLALVLTGLLGLCGRRRTA